MADPSLDDLGTRLAIVLTALDCDQAQLLGNQIDGVLTQTSSLQNSLQANHDVGIWNLNGIHEAECCISMADAMVDRILELLTEAGARLPDIDFVCTNDITLDALASTSWRKMRSYMDEFEEEIRLLRASTLLIHELYTSRAGTSVQERATATSRIAALARVKVSILRHQSPVDDSDSESDSTSLSAPSTRHGTGAIECFYSHPPMPSTAPPPPPGGHGASNVNVNLLDCRSPGLRQIPSDRPTASQDDIEPELPSYDSVVPFDGMNFPQDNKLTQMYADKVSHHQLNEDIAEMQRRYRGCLAREHRRMQVAGLEDLIRRKAQLTAFTEAPKYLVQLCKEVDFFTSAVEREPSSTTNNAHEPFKRLETANANLSYSRRHLITIMVSQERDGWNIQPANYSSADIDSKINSNEQGETTRVDHAWQVWLSIPMTGRSKISIWLENHAVEGARSELIHAEQTSKGASGLGKLLQTLRLKTKTPRQAFLLVYKAATLAEHVIEPVKFKDCVGRVFTLPWEQANTWTKMAILIENAFECFGELGEEIQQKRYDLFNEAGEILLPNTSSCTIKPGMVVTQHLWPEVPPWERESDLEMHTHPRPGLQLRSMASSSINAPGSTGNSFAGLSFDGMPTISLSARSTSQRGPLFLPPPPPLMPQPSTVRPPVPSPTFKSLLQPPMATDLCGPPPATLANSAGWMVPPPPPPLSPPPVSTSSWMADPPPIDVDSSGLPPDMPPVGKPSALSSYSDRDSLSDVNSINDYRSFAWDITSLDIDGMSDEAIVDRLKIQYLVRVDKKHIDRDVEEPREHVVRMGQKTTRQK